MKKNYVVRVTSPSDWPEIHRLLLQDGTLDDNIPSNACECVDLKAIYGDKATYLLDEEEVNILKNNPKVRYVELDPSLHPEAYPLNEVDALRFPIEGTNEGKSSKVYKSTEGPASSSPPATMAGAPTPTDEYLRTGWQLIRPYYKSDQWGQNSINYESVVGSEAQNRYYAAKPKTFVVQYSANDTGKNVDCVVIDNGAWHGHPEFVNKDGTSEILDIILDGPYYLDKEYFDANASKTTTFLGRTTCTESAALEWWSTASKRSSSFSSVPTISGINSGYTRANVCGSYSAYPALSSGTEPAGAASFANHGTGVASTVYGKTLGWAFESRKWNIAADIGFSLTATPSATKVYEILQLFAQHKPLTEGVKSPTVINASYGMVTKVANEWAAGTYYYNFRGTTGSFTSKATAPEFLKNFADDDNSKHINATIYPSIKDPGDALVRTSGVIFISSAGNCNAKLVNPNDADYNNYWSSTNPGDVGFDIDTDANWVCRRGAPTNFLLSDNEDDYGVIAVGALSGYLDTNKKENKDWYSNSGTAVDVLAPASGTLSAAGNSSQETFERYDSQSFYSWLSKDAYDCVISGTSTASPVAAGLIASKLTKNLKWGIKNVKKYIKYLMPNLLTSNFEVGTGDITTATDSGWNVVNNLHGQDPKIIFNSSIPEIPFVALPSIVDVKGSSNITLQVSASANQVEAYTYQWQKASLSNNSFTNITGANASSYVISNPSVSDIGTKYRAIIFSDSYYTETFSNETTLSLNSSISIEQQPANLRVNERESVAFSVEAENNIEEELSYQWQKFNTELFVWEGLAGKTSFTLNITGALAIDSGFYRCVITDGFSPVVFTDSAELVVQIAELSFTKEPLNVLKFEGDSATLEAEAVSTVKPAVLYKWQKLSADGSTWGDIKNANSKIFTIDTLSASDAGFYRVKASDGVSSNSPRYSAFAELEVKEVVLNLASIAPFTTAALEGDEVFVSVSASLNNGKRPTFKFEKKRVISIPDQPNVVVWDIVEVNDTGNLFFQKIRKVNAGRYRCNVSDFIANNSPVTFSPIDIGVNDSFVVNSISSDPGVAVLDSVITLTPEVFIKSEKLNYYYLWQRKDSGATEWESLYKENNKTLAFVATGKDHQTEFRCKVSNELSNEIITPAFTLSFGAFVDLTQDLPEKIIFPENSLQEHTLDPAVVSTHLSTVSYQWQKSLDDEATWSDISGSTDKKLIITPSLAKDLNSSNDTDHYSLRLKISFGETSTVSYSNSTYIDLKDAINLFGINACLTQEQVEELAITDATSPNPSPDAHGNSLLPDRTYIEEINTSPIDPVDKCKDKNTCGISIEELFDTYTIYDTQKGLYKSWGDIEFVWQLEEARSPSGVTCNLNASETNDKWQVSQYKALYAYFPKIGAGGLASPTNATCLTERSADRVLRIEDDGYKVSLYEAQELVTSISGPFDKTKWKKICHIITSVPAGLPTPQEIKERYKPYELDFFLKKWEEYNATWDEDFYQQSFDQCRNNNSTLDSIEKCMKEKNGPYGQSNDQWEQARVRKDLFYKVGDYAWVEGECKDTVCLYICIQDIPATKLIFDELKQFKPSLRLSSSVTNYAVTVQSVSAGNRYFIDGSQQPAINLREGQTYRFNQDNSSNTNHPVRFSTTPNGTHGGGAEFTQGVTKVGTAGSRGAYTEITVPAGAPTLYYYCANHSLMGGTANTLGLTFWRRVYCVNTGMNKCLEPQRNRDLPNYQLVEIGSLGHYVEQPIPYFDLQGNKLCPDYELLNDFLEEQPPKVLTQEEIDALDQP